jgi:hypothetical protein
MLRTGNDLVKNNLSTSAAQHIIDTSNLIESDKADFPIATDSGWYFEGEEIKAKSKAAGKKVEE